MSKTTTLIIALLSIACTSCIPLRIAPKIEDYKIKVGKRFKRYLPRQHAFIFSDPKETYDFYYYFINKYKVEDGEALHNQEFTLDEEKYYISYYDAENTNKDN